MGSPNEVDTNVKDSIIDGLKLVALHKATQEIVDQTCDMLNLQWPRSRTARMHSLKQSRDSMPSHWVLVKSDSNEVVAHVRIVHHREKVLMIESLLVSTSLRGQNLGSKLIERLEQKLMPSSWRLLCELELEKYYAKLGFILDGRKSFPVHGNKERLVMVKELEKNNQS